METRRSALKKISSTALALGVGSNLLASPIQKNNLLPLKGNINHSACRWTFQHLSLDDMCLLVKRIDFSAIDLVGPKEWHILKKHEVDSSMCNGAEISLVEGWNNKQFLERVFR